MGERGARRDPSTPDDNKAMAQLAAEAVRAGALGFSTSRTLNHRTSTGDFTPTLKAGEDELTAIAAGMNNKMFAALKPGGLLVIADHSAKPGEGISVAKTLHRIEEKVLREEIEAAGFKLVAEADFLRNPDDPRDTKVFQPAIPVDEFVLKYRKPE